MAVILDIAVQGVQMFLILALAPLFTGFVRKVKARLLRRQGPSVWQPYRDLLRLIRKEVVLAENASWLFRVAPYLILATTWVAAALVPTFATGLLFSWSADLIAIVALLGSARFLLALAGMDVGTSFGGIGSSRAVMFASLAGPAMLMIVFTLSLLAGSTQLSYVAAFMQIPEVGLRMALGAERGDIVRFVLRLAMVPVLVGTALGLAVSSQLGKTLQSLLIGVDPRDTLTLALGAILALSAAFAASVLPAARAARIEPAAALRSE
jgi:formate hydrogenlyase subunit 4